MSEQEPPGVDPVLEPSPDADPAPAPAPARPGLRELALSTRLGTLLLVTGGVGFWFGAQIAVGVVIAVVYLVQHGGQQAGLEAFLNGMAPWLAVASAGAALAVVGGLRALRTLPATPPTASTRHTVLWVLGLALACLGGQAAISWGQRRAGLEFAEQQLFSDGLKRDGKYFLAFAIVVLAPLGEELLFRRVAYGALAGPWGRPLAALSTALLFAVVHLNLPGLFMYTWLALCCTIAYERCGRAAAPIAVHGINNLVAATSLIAA